MDKIKDEGRLLTGIESNERAPHLIRTILPQQPPYYEGSRGSFMHILATGGVRMATEKETAGISHGYT